MKLVYLILLILFSFIVNAAFISIQTTTEVSPDHTSIKTINKGDEPAYNVNLELSINNIVKKSKNKDVLNINGIIEDSFEIDRSSLMQGTYPLTIKTNYQDANKYQFSATSLILFENIIKTNADLGLSMQNIELSDKANLKFIIENSNTDKLVNIKFLTSNELRIGTINDLELKENSKIEKTVKIENLAARIDSKYVIYVIATYIENNEHFTAFTTAQVDIKAGKDKTIPKILTGSLIILVLLFVVLYFKRK